MIKAHLLSAALVALVCATSSARGYPLDSLLRSSATPHGFIKGVAASDDEEMSPEEMEAALEKEQARQTAMEDLERQISAPLAAFSSVYERSLNERDAAAHKALDGIFNQGGCNLSAVERLRGEFISSKAAKAGKAEIESTRAQLTDSARSYRISFSSTTPPDATPKLLQALNEAAPKIKALNAEYGRICSTSQQQMKKIPVTDAAKMMAMSSEIQAREASLGSQVDQIVGTLNQQVDALDASLIAWALQPLKTAQPK
ncbi:hypothetical protein LJD17_12925 [Microvirga rosea]|nr:hypothetical protein [Microvirga rosea]